jgi:hypothetical protein
MPSLAAAPTEPAAGGLRSISPHLDLGSQAFDPSGGEPKYDVEVGRRDDPELGEALLVSNVGGLGHAGGSGRSSNASLMSRAPVGCVLRAPGRPVDLERYACREGSRIDQLKRYVRAGVGE